MTKAHIVFTQTESTAVIKNVVHTIVNTLTNAGWTVGCTNLECWHNVESVGNAPALAANTKNEIKTLAACDTLVLIFPVIWCSVPASMKHWIETVFRKQPDDGNISINNRSCMQGKKVIVVAISEEVERIVRDDCMDAALAIMLRPLFEGTLNYLGFNVLRPYFIHHEDLSRVNGTNEILANVATLFSQLQRRPSYYGMFPPAPGLSRLSM